MGKIDIGNLNDFSGRVGGMIVYRYNGKTYVRRMPKREKVMRCEAVLEQQERIAGVAALYRAVKDGGLLPVWQAAAQGSGLTGYNWFVRENQKCFTKKGMVGDFEKVALTVGELALPDELRLAPAEEGWELTWKNESVFPPCDGSDRLAVALMKDERSFVVKVPDIGEWQRKHCRALIRLPTELEEYKHLFVFFCSADGKAMSRSKYFSLT